MKKIVLSLILIAICNYCSAQKPSSPCSTPEASQFDFWLGDWDAVYSDTLQPATNKISRPFNNCIIQENFYDPNTNFHGMSVSGYNAQKKQWQQTWVDGQGAYIALTGEFRDGKMQLNSERTQADGKKILLRMLYYNISKDSFDWSWDSSVDGGKTWIVNWKIHYKRRV